MRRADRPTSRALSSALACAALLVCAPCVAAQAPSRSTNLSYLSTYGIGGYDAGAQTVRALTLPLSLQMRDMDQRHWGLRLRVPITFGVTDIELDPDVVLDNLKAVTVLPTVELQIPLSKRWTLTPFAGLGVAHEFSLDRTAAVATSGVKLQAVAPWNAWEIEFGTALRYDFNADFDGTGFDDYGRLEFEIGLLRELGASVDGHHFKPGVYAHTFTYLDPLTFEGPAGREVSIDAEYELGLSLLTVPTVRILGVGLPRINVGYRFGEHIEGLRITFGELL